MRSRSKTSGAAATVPSRSLRFPPNCVSLLFNLLVKNKTFDANGANDTIKKEWHFMKPSVLDPAVYLEPALSGGAFFSSVGVEVNENPLDPQKLGTNGWFYQVFNRTFMTEKRRLEKYGGPIPRVSNYDQRSTANLAASPNLRDCLTSLEGESKITSKPKLLRFSPDGVYPFDHQSNQAAALCGVNNPSAFLPEGVDLVFRFQKRYPAHLVLENAAIDDDTYYSDTPATADMQRSFKFDIKAMEITYEVLTMPARAERKSGEEDAGRDPRKKRRRTSRPKERETYLRWYQYVDVPKVHFQAVPGGQQVTNATVNLPAGSKFVAVTWVMSHQIFPSSTQLKNLAARFQFPPGAKHLTMEIDGKSVLLNRGLADVGTGADANVSRSCADYHGYLVNAGLYSKSFENLFPPKGARGYDGFLFVDLGNMVLKKPAQLEIEVTYAKTSAENYYLGSVSVSQYKYSYHGNLGIEAVPVV